MGAIKPVWESNYLLYFMHIKSMIKRGLGRDGALTEFPIRRPDVYEVVKFNGPHSGASSGSPLDSVSSANGHLVSDAGAGATRARLRVDLL